MNFLAVGAGGALGAMLRYAISLFPNKTEFPALTLITNFIGAFVIGFIVGLAEKKNLSDNSLLFWKTGVCGGFTTFSTFSLEAITLFESGHVCMGIIYVACSLGLCLLGVVAGKWIVALV